MALLPPSFAMRAPKAPQQTEQHTACVTRAQRHPRPALPWGAAPAPFCGPLWGLGCFRRGRHLNEESRYFIRWDFSFLCIISHAMFSCARAAVTQYLNSAKATEMHGLPVLEAGSQVKVLAGLVPYEGRKGAASRPVPALGVCWSAPHPALWLPHPDLCLPVPPPHGLLPACVCVQTSSLHKDASPPALGPAPLHFDLVLTNYICI